MLEDALVTINDAKERALLARATEIAIRSGIIPLHFQMNVGDEEEPELQPTHRRIHLRLMFKPSGK